MIALGCLAWFVVGALAPIYFMKRDFGGFNGPIDVVLAAMCGIIGPAAWFVGWFVHSELRRK